MVAVKPPFIASRPSLRSTFVKLLAFVNHLEASDVAFPPRSVIAADKAPAELLLNPELITLTGVSAALTQIPYCVLPAKVQCEIDVGGYGAAVWLGRPTAEPVLKANVQFVIAVEIAGLNGPPALIV